MEQLNINGWSNFPEAIIFDLDFTLWPLYMDSYTSGPPFKRIDNFSIQDWSGEKVSLYPDVHDIIHAIREHRTDTKIGIASRSHTGDWCRAAIQLLPIRKPHLPETSEDHLPLHSYIDAHEIYPGSKTTHFRALSEKLEVDLSSMLFFDDEQRNITEIGKMGVTCILVKNGLCIKDFHRGLAEYQAKKAASGVMRNWLAAGGGGSSSNKRDKRARERKGEAYDEEDGASGGVVRKVATSSEGVDLD
ncbi:hypothetical protein SmJEL517_g05158 [Synchytrium microbalum]|uniref:Magnesium-dependent phosphatase-1 n=1 Tax=Synchytrium microbalum TaxID=1806994 RepID=A0A507BWJ7_9FUNG|nr:uncharacterized protein SmJEL517_g05158 [Synchytrium microbalum]TPX31538.1 hypothetical protein SmJEL517_g05158 [Synchytrium microbalum]